MNRRDYFVCKFFEKYLELLIKDGHTIRGIQQDVHRIPHLSEFRIQQQIDNCISLANYMDRKLKENEEDNYE